ncbi:TPA: LPS O-antigen length regulator [Escherichia coli]|nr:LPS O-antigen length regulator [Escherichia coli]
MKNPRENEVDLVALLNTMWCKRKTIFINICVFVVIGLFVSFVYPYKWTSEAVITPAESVSLTDLEKALTRLHILDVDVKTNKDELFNLFIKEFKSTSLLDQYLRSSSYVKQLVRGKENDEGYLHRTVVALSNGMSAVSDNISQKNNVVPYTSWTLSFTASSAEDARDLLTGYINYVSENVVKTVVQNMRDQLVVKTEYEREKLAQDRIKLRNQLDAKIQRLRYSLEIANAAGIVRPPYSNGQTIKDDPDFPISLGVDGIKRKLEIEKSLEDIAEINGDLRNRQFMLEKLTRSRVDGVEFTPFSYQAKPSLPVRQDGPGKLLIVILSTLTGFMVACGSVLLRQVILSP